MAPLAFAPYQTRKPHNQTYYRINIKNFSIFYVVIDDTMEVRRLIYSRRDINKIYSPPQMRGANCRLIGYGI